jgi:hypothetical protein
VRNNKGSQLASVNWVTLKAELHMRQNVAIGPGSGNIENPIWGADCHLEIK